MIYIKAERLFSLPFLLPPALPLWSVFGAGQLIPLSSVPLALCCCWVRWDPLRCCRLWWDVFCHGGALLGVEELLRWMTVYWFVTFCWAIPFPEVGNAEGGRRLVQWWRNWFVDAAVARSLSIEFAGPMLVFKMYLKLPLWEDRNSTCIR